MHGCRWNDQTPGMELTLDTGKKLVSQPSGITNDPAISAQAGDIIFAAKMKEKAESCAFVGFETLPWACRFTEWGKRATILGTKGSILAAVTPPSESDRAISTLQGLLGVFPMIQKSPNNLGISLRNPGQVI